MQYFIKSMFVFSILNLWGNKYGDSMHNECQNLMSLSGSNRRVEQTAWNRKDLEAFQVAASIQYMQSLKEIKIIAKSGGNLMPQILKEYLETDLSRVHAIRYRKLIDFSKSDNRSAMMYVILFKGGETISEEAMKHVNQMRILREVFLKANELFYKG